MRPMRRKARLAARFGLPYLAACVAGGCAAAGAGAGGPGSSAQPASIEPAAMPTGLFDPDERILIGDFQRVTALARSPRHLFAATHSGLLARDLAFERWELPMTGEDGYPVGRATALAYDPREAVLWLATDVATLVQIDPDRKRVLDEWRLDAPVSSLIPGAANGSVLYGRTSSGWREIDAFSRTTRPIDARTVAAAIEADRDLANRQRLLSDPQFEAARPLLGWRGDRRYAVTDLATGLRDGEVWVATDGGGLELLDLYGARSRPIAYGPVGRGAAAVLATDEAIWFAPEVGLDRYGVARADPRLQEWQAWDDTGSPLDGGEPPDLPVTVLAASGDIVWAGGAGTLHWFQDGKWSRQLLGSAARDDRVTALHPVVVDGPSESGGPAGGVWVGTASGLMRVGRPGDPAERVSSGIVPVRSLATSEGVLWVGGDRGLFVVTDSAGRRDMRVDASPGSPLGSVNALAADGRVLYAGVGTDVWVRRDGSWRRAGPLGATTVRVESLAVHRGALWIGTAEGVTIWDTRSDRIVSLSFATGDLPVSRFGERGVRDISLAADGTAWLATPAGALRIRTGP